MADTILVLLLAMVGFPGMLVLPPAVLLLIGWSHMRARRYPMASVFATAAEVWSWLLLALEVPIVFFALLAGSRPWEQPHEIAFVAYPPMMWVFARTLRSSAAEEVERDRVAELESREEEREAPTSGEE